MEDNVINGSKKVKTSPFVAYLGDDDKIEDTIQNGVKETELHKGVRPSAVENTIEDGVKCTLSETSEQEYLVEKTIQNGVKETHRFGMGNEAEIEDAIQNGVKYTHERLDNLRDCVYDVIENGVKETKPMDEWVNSESIVEKTIQGGIKETKTPGDDGDLLSTMEWMEENETNSVPKLIDYVVKHGVKETKSVSNNFEDVMFSDKISPHTYADDFTQDHWVQTVVENGIKQTNTWDDDILGKPDRVEVVIKETNPTRFANVEDAIENGVKETISEEHHRLREVVNTLKIGIKEVKELPDMSGELRGYGDYYRRQKDMAKPHILYVKDVIENGDKEELKKSI